MNTLPDFVKDDELSFIKETNLMIKIILGWRDSSFRFVHLLFHQRVIKGYKYKYSDKCSQSNPQEIKTNEASITKLNIVATNQD